MLMFLNSAFNLTNDQIMHITAIPYQKLNEETEFQFSKRKMAIAKNSFQPLSAIEAERRQAHVKGRRVTINTGRPRRRRERQPGSKMTSLQLMLCESKETGARKSKRTKT
jgi:hypothetical protein